MTFVRVKITLRVEIALYVYKSHTCVLQSHFAFKNYTHAGVYHTMRVKHHIVREHLIMREHLTMCVIITLCV
jgi:hypothetical protein